LDFPYWVESIEFRNLHLQLVLVDDHNGYNRLWRYPSSHGSYDNNVFPFFIFFLENLQFKSIFLCSSWNGLCLNCKSDSMRDLWLFLQSDRTDCRLIWKRIWDIQHKHASKSSLILKILNSLSKPNFHRYLID